MFDLEREVSHWCRKTYTWPHYRKSQVAELEDHLHCAVARCVKQGLVPEDAFKCAVAELGEIERLRTEYRKNWSRISFLARAVEFRRIRIAIALGFAGLFFGAALLARDVELIQWTTNLIVAIYTVPFKFFGIAA